MSIEVNQAGFDYARKLIAEGRFVADHGDWGEVNPGTEAQNAFIEENGIEAWSLWHLGRRAGDAEDNKETWAFPYGDYQNVCRSGLLAADERARQYGYDDIRQAALDLLRLLDDAAGDADTPLP